MGYGAELRGWGSQIADSAAGYRVLAVDSMKALSAFREPWEKLAASAIEPNVFYEPWLMLPALEAFGRDGETLFLLVFSPEGVLVGMFPFERRRTYMGLPVRTLSLWRHIHCFLCTPLIQTGHEDNCLEALFAWLGEHPGEASVCEFRNTTGDGRFQSALERHCLERGRQAFVAHRFHRALLVRGGSAEEYMRHAMSGSHRRALARHLRRIRETGALAWRVTDEKSDVGSWITGFLSVEASGWKGRLGTALACHPREARFFESAVKAAHGKGRLLMAGLFVDGRAIAYRVSFGAGDGAFAFKSAFDERWRHHSPGALLEVETIRRLHAVPGLQWMDSCTKPDNVLLNRMWPDRRCIQSVAVAVGRGRSRFLLSVLSALGAGYGGPASMLQTKK